MNSVKVQNRFFELFTPEITKLISNKDFRTRTSHWISRWIDKCESEARLYFRSKEKLLHKYARRYEADGQITDATGNVLRRWKKGDLVMEGGNILLNDPERYLDELASLQDDTVEILGINPIPFDEAKEPRVSPGEMRLLNPIIEFIEGRDKPDKEVDKRK